MIKLIVAADRNGNIGHNNKLPWHLPTDLRYFQTLTKNHIIVMGRNTWDSLHRVDGLPHRLNVILTSNQNLVPNNKSTKVINSLDWLVSDESLELQKTRDIWIIGGANLYKQALDMGAVDEIYYTYINKAFIANIAFPYPVKLTDEIGKVKIGMDTFKLVTHKRAEVTQQEPPIYYLEFTKI